MEEDKEIIKEEIEETMIIIIGIKTEKIEDREASFAKIDRMIEIEGRVILI